MEKEIELSLNMIYRNLIINVLHYDIRKYEIRVQIEYMGQYKTYSLIYTYNVRLTLHENINIMETNIDKYIILPFFKKEG